LVALLIGQGSSFSSTAPTSKPIGSSSGALSMSAQHNDELNGATGRRDFISRVAAAAVLASSQRPAYAADDEAATSPPPPAPSPTMKGQESFDMQTFLTKKRYQVSTPEFDTKAVMKGKAFAVKKWNDSGIELSNIEAAAAAAIVSYPLAYIQFLWSDYVDEQGKIAKKARMAAKKAKAAAAKKAKAAAEKKKASVDKKVKKKKKGKKSSDKAKSKPVKGEEAAAAEMLDSSREKVSAAAVEKAKSDTVAAEMLDSSREKVSAAAVEKAKTEQVAKEMLDSTREKATASAQGQSIPAPFSGPKKNYAKTSASWKVNVADAARAAAEMLDSTRERATEAAQTITSPAKSSSPVKKGFNKTNASWKASRSKGAESASADTVAADMLDSTRSSVTEALKKGYGKTNASWKSNGVAPNSPPQPSKGSASKKGYGIGSWRK